MKHCQLSGLCQAIGVVWSGEDKIITGLNTLDEATPSHVSFFNHEKHSAQLQKTQAAGVLIEARYAHLLPPHTAPLIADEPYLKLALASKLFRHTVTTKSQAPKIGVDCDIDPSVRFGCGVVIGDRVTILAGCYIGDDAVIGPDTMLYANVTLYHQTHIGARCIIHSGTVIGSDGYGFAQTKAGEHVKIYQNGNVIIENDVEIGANCAIDRGVFGATVIAQGSKLDNLVHIAHNCKVGAYALLTSQVGLAGSTTTGRNVVMGGQSGAAGHLHIGDFSTIAAKSGVTKSLKGYQTYAGFPAVEHRLWLKIQAKLSSLAKK
jgi:UDP-3-O-[3-hydroxymyristoyl] glucosamine N-acyltransferase